MTTVSCRSLTSIRLKTTLHWQRRRSQNSAALPVKMPQAASLNELLFEHTALECLPVDPNPDRDVRREIPGTCFSLVDTQPLESPEVVCLSQNALDLLGVQVDEQDPSTPKLLSLGTTFSNWQLGDGAATSIGEVNTAEGRWEMQFKGAGQTPYSRAGDGRKVLRSSLREFLASEAMYHLGIPTTRAASVCTSKSTVVRDPFYTDNVIHEPCAVVLRLAPSFLRFGSLEICRRSSNTGRKGPSSETPQLLNSILDYLTFYHFRSIWDLCGGGPTVQQPPVIAQQREMYLRLYEQIVERTLKLCAQWQGVGFCHGVLNTDNMSMLGLTIDYGPYGWLDRYDEGHICNASDDGGRYAFGKQPWAVQENLDKLADMIKLAGVDAQQVSRVHRSSEERYNKHFQAVMRRKLGFVLTREEDEEIVTALQACMQQTGVDFTITFRNLSRVPLAAEDNGSVDSGVQAFLDVVLPTCPDPSAMAEGMKSQIDPRQLMLLRKVASEQPAMLARIGLSCEEVALEASKNERAAIIAAQAPADKKTTDESAWRDWLGLYQLRLQHEVAGGAKAEERVASMHAANPKIVLRNWVAQVAIDAATKGDYASVKRVLRLLEEPFKEWPQEDMLLDAGGQQWPADQPPPPPLANLCVSCSS